MQTILIPGEISSICQNAKLNRKKVSLIPTMGALHRGHRSLIEIARKKSDLVVVSIFVNPLQFGPGEDYESYPRQHEKDLAVLRELGVDYVFAPRPEYINRSNPQVFLYAPGLGQQMCGNSRPIFFRGVLTIVHKLFQIVKPDIAVFGKKDYQQLFLVRKMVEEFFLDIDIIAGEIVREPNGVAMSSRNQYLDSGQKEIASQVYSCLAKVQTKVNSEGMSGPECVSYFQSEIETTNDLQLDYAELRYQKNLLPVAEKTTEPTVLLVALKLGHVRLIDNVELTGG